MSFDLNISRFNGLSIMQDIFSLLCELFEFESYGRYKIALSSDFSQLGAWIWLSNLDIKLSSK